MHKSLDYSKIFLSVLFVILVLPLFISFASAQEIYVSNNCEGVPLCYSSLSQAVSYASDNDKIIIKKGVYFVDPLKIKIDMTIEGEDRENTILYPSANTACCTGDSQAWFLVNENVIFNVYNLTFDGYGRKISQAIRSFGYGHIYNNIFRNISWSDNQGAAIVAFGGTTIIQSNSFSGIGRNAIWVGSYYNEEDFGLDIPVVGNNYMITNNILKGKGECDCIDKGIEIGIRTSKTKISGNNIFNYKGRYSAEQSYSMGIFAWNLIGENLGIEIYNNSIHDCIIPIFLKNQGSDINQIKISGNNMYNNEFDGLNTNYNQDTIINFEGLKSNDSVSGKPEKSSNFSSKPDYLFDVILEIQDKNLKKQDPLNAILKFQSFGAKPTQTHINYIILDNYNKEVFSETEDIVVETEQVITKRFDNLNLLGGDYTLYVKIDYANISDNFKQDFFVEDASGQVAALWMLNSEGNTYLYFIGGVLMALILLIIYMKYRKTSITQVSQGKMEVKAKR